MLYELREYVAVPGRFTALIKLFTEHTVPALDKYGVELVQAGTTWIGENSFNELVYTLRFADAADLTRKWQQVTSDTGWSAAFHATQAEGPFIHSMKRRLLDGLPIDKEADK